MAKVKYKAKPKEVEYEVQLPEFVYEIRVPAKTIKNKCNASRITSTVHKAIDKHFNQDFIYKTHREILEQAIDKYQVPISITGRTLTLDITKVGSHSYCPPSLTVEPNTRITLRKKLLTLTQKKFKEEEIKDLDFKSVQVLYLLYKQTTNNKFTIACKWLDDLKTYTRSAVNFGIRNNFLTELSWKNLLTKKVVFIVPGADGFHSNILDITTLEIKTSVSVFKVDEVYNFSFEKNKLFCFTQKGLDLFKDNYDKEEKERLIREMEERLTNKSF